MRGIAIWCCRLISTSLPFIKIRRFLCNGNPYTQKDGIDVEASYLSKSTIFEKSTRESLNPEKSWGALAVITLHTPTGDDMIDVWPGKLKDCYWPARNATFVASMLNWIVSGWSTLNVDLPPNYPVQQAQHRLLISSLYRYMIIYGLAITVQFVNELYTQKINILGF